MYNKTKTGTDLPQTMGSKFAIDQQHQNHRLRTDSKRHHGCNIYFLTLKYTNLITGTIKMRDRKV